MYTIVIGTILAAVLFVISEIKLRRVKARRVYGWEMGITCFIIFCAVGALAGALVAVQLTRLLSKIEYTESQPLAAMRNADEFSGSFVLGSGNVASSPSYRVYVRNADSSVTLRSISASSISILESADLHDQGYWNVTWRALDRSSLVAKFAINIGGRTFVSQQLVVPVGTVKLAFKVE